MNTTAAQVPTLEDALYVLGDLTTNTDGWDTWTIRNLDGTVYAYDVASDHDAAWLAQQVVHNHR